MRLLLLLTLIHGLVPGVGEIVEAVVHYAAEGHLAHSDADHGDLGDQGHEHGCGTTEHLCSCCSSLTFVAPAAGGVLPAAPTASHRLPAGVRVASLDAPAPPLRPPIAS
jgi:hypothetical protein